MPKFGLIGKNISYSFSKSFFTDKFEREGLPHRYVNFDIPSIVDFPEIIVKNPGLLGLNITIPYKESVIPFLDALDETAESIGAVNVIKIAKNRKLIGYNSDYYGFQKALAKFLPLKNKNALILGTGGASRAIAFSLHNLGFQYTFVSRSIQNNVLLYSDLTAEIIQNYLLVVNCTPLGTFPHTQYFPAIPYQFLTEDHLLYDLIYNPSETQFLKQGKLSGAQTCNGLAMLEYQAEKAWKIWNL